jgi:hypothetical protein|tara:strand:+ start:2262 stop:2717 length:456 start_codon:yes stop_codon:yes gene_type:complete
MSTFIKGDENILYVYNTATSAYEPMACLTSNSLSSTLGVNEVVTKCDPGEVIKTAGTFDYSISGDGLYIDTGVGAPSGDELKQSHDKLLALQLAKTKVNWKVDTGLATNTEYFGEGFITDLAMESPTGGENTTFSVTISGSGDISLVDLIP